MGEQNTQTLIVNSPIRESVQQIQDEAKRRGLHVSELMQSGRFAFYTLVVVPSGSTYGHEDDTNYMQVVNELVDWIDVRRKNNDPTAPWQEWVICDYALVNFGVGMELELSIALPPHIMRHSEYIGE